MATIGKQLLVQRISESTGEPMAQVGRIMDLLLTEMQSALLHGRTVRLPGIGSLQLVERAARTGRNPQTGEALSIPAGVRVKFKASKELL
ncbi:MAG: HU family DNA-binding protein [Pseudomonadota bacterium]